MQVDVVRKIASGIALVALVAFFSLAFAYNRFIRTVESAATDAGFVDRA